MNILRKIGKAVFPTKYQLVDKRGLYAIDNSHKLFPSKSVFKLKQTLFDNQIYELTNGGKTYSLHQTTVDKYFIKL